ncbi:hypothetical protein SAMN05216299_11338 [Nitrosospira sp. Nsp14]|nr:hypothetical protein SAMN05216299_11338 [Nitrosospira sp. Nsp14]
MRAHHLCVQNGSQWPPRRHLRSIAVHNGISHLEGSGTHLRLTEQLAYLDGRYGLGERICRTGEGLDRLVLEVMENLHSIKH